MNRFLVSLVIFTTASCFSSMANSRELIVEFTGSTSKTTGSFEVQAPWIADWRVTGDYPGQMAVDVSLATAPLGEHVGKIATTKYVSNGVRLFNEGGRFQFNVNSSLANWTLRVEQLTRAEAETYEPKEKLK